MYNLFPVHRAFRWMSLVLLFAGLCNARQYRIGSEVKRQSSTSLLRDFEVHEPIHVPYTSSGNKYGCVYTKTLMEHVFAYSYGSPFVGNYTPPPCSFNRVTINFTVTSAGRQYDRLGIMYFGDIEVWRTSTAEPTTNGIVWTFIKEMDQYNALWKTSQKLIFDLGNLVNSVYTGKFNTTLTATFFTIPDERERADSILPISALKAANNKASAFTVPSDNASVSYTFSRNIRRAVVSISACGQSAEEFWYTNVLSSQTETFEASTGTLYGYSPFREVQLLIDGTLAGVYWPFPTIFTGGIVPGLWRPIVGIDAFDISEHEIDITPWLPYLRDGTSHAFEIRVAGLSDDGNGNASITETVGSYWVVTGKIFLFSSDSNLTVTGTKPLMSIPSPSIAVTSSVIQSANGTNISASYNVIVSRSLVIASALNESNDSDSTNWTQELSFSNTGLLTNEGATQVNTQQTKGKDVASESDYSSTYEYPIWVNSSYAYDADDNLSLWAALTRGLSLAIMGESVFPSGIQTFNMSNQSTIQTGFGNKKSKISKSLPYFQGSLLSTSQNGTAAYYSTSNGSSSYGTTSQDFEFSGYTTDSEDLIELYSRSVSATNATVTDNYEYLVGATYNGITTSGFRGTNQNVGAFSVRKLLGRGPEGIPDVNVSRAELYFI